jgi:peptidoglycan/LPS O-acetylase OafA/YrhL
MCKIWSSEVRVRRIAEFEALRGLLALWVVVGHVFRHSGYEPEDLGHFGLLASPGLPVDVFIILSGFVIFNLLDHKDEGYFAFIIRRFFRLFPLFVAVLLVSASFAGLHKSWVDNFPWKTSYFVGLSGIADASVEHLSSQIAVHLTMLHGLVPDSILPFSEYGIVGQAWSISVEWQFYLVAPLLFFLSRRAPAILSILVLAIVLLHSRYWLGEGFAINQAAYFAVGILCYFVFKNRDVFQRAPGMAWLAGAVSIMIVAYLMLRPVSLALWIGVFALVVNEGDGGRNLISAACRSRPFQFLGKISYSIYLTHALVLDAVSLTVLHLFPDITKPLHFNLAMLLTLPLTLILSALTYFLIEKPGMAVGQSLADKVATRYGASQSSQAPAATP